MHYCFTFRVLTTVYKAHDPFLFCFLCVCNSLWIILIWLTNIYLAAGTIFTFDTRAVKSSYCSREPTKKCVNLSVCGRILSEWWEIFTGVYLISSQMGLAQEVIGSWWLILLHDSIRKNFLYFCFCCPSSGPPQIPQFLIIVNIKRPCWILIK